MRFRIVEVLKGRKATEVVLPGYLVDRDDFNEGPVPYTFVRKNGRSGSCFANSYRNGAQFLLFLKSDRGSWTVNWSALEPVNEELHADEDPWVVWVRDEILWRHATEPPLDRQMLDRTYAVYSSVLQAIVAGEVPLGEPTGRRPSILASTVSPVADRTGALDSLEQRWPQLSSTTLLNYQRVKNTTQPIVRRFTPAIDNLLLSPFATYTSESVHAVGFSGVGFNSSADQALVYVYYACGRSCGDGLYALLKRDRDRWRVEATQSVWSAHAAR